MEIKQATLEPWYRVTKDGRVFSLKWNWRGMGDRQLTALPNSHGYLRVRLTMGNKNQRKSYFVHALVARFYLPSRPTLAHEIRHLDGNRINNHADNLAWGTRFENAQDRERHGKTSRGLKHSLAIKNGLAKAEGK